MTAGARRAPVDPSGQDHSPRRQRVPTRRSLATRLTLRTFAAGVVLIVLLLIVVSSLIRDDVLDDRQAAILSDARQRIASVQTELDASTASTPDQIAGLTQDLVARLGQASASSGGIGVVMVRSSKETSQVVVNDLATDTRLPSLVTSDLSSALEASSDGGQYWQSVTVPGQHSDAVPGLIVGGEVTVPQAGTYDLYIVYSLENEQELADLTTRAIAWTAAGFLIILLVAVWALAYNVLIPIRRTAAAAERLAQGHLDERLPVRGRDEIAILSESFNGMADSLAQQIDNWERLSSVQRLFVSDVSHELRTPLTSITLAAEQLNDSRDEIKDRLALRSLDILLREVARFRRLFDDLLTISRVDSGRVQLTLEELDMSAVVDSVIGDNQLHVDRLGANLEVATIPGSLVAQMDEARIERIVRNLLVNALEHAEGTLIEITIAGNDNAVAVRVRDHGIGMTPEVASKVFDRFYRADPSRQRTLGGTGLGLSIAAEDAALHGGTLEAWGWPGEGASFLLTLPRAQGPDGERGRLSGPGPLPLVPDDAPDVARSSSHTTTGATSGSSHLPPAPASRRTDAPWTPSDGQDDAPPVVMPPGARAAHDEGQSRRVKVREPGQPPTADTPQEVTDQGRRR